MAILMLAILITLLVAAYFGGNKKFLSPWFLLCAITLASYIIVLANFNNWQVSINVRFVLYIMSALLAFGAGTFLVAAFAKKDVAEKGVSLSIENGSIPIERMRFNKKYPVNVFLVLSIILAMGYIGKLFLDVDGFSMSFTAALRKIYDIKSSDDYTPGFIFNQMFEIVKAIAYINTFRLLIKVYSNKRKRKDDRISATKLIIPIIVMLVVTLISTDRNIFIRYGIYFICIWMFFYYNNCKKKNINLQIVFVVAIIVAVAAIIFFIMGKMKQYTSDFIKSISIYAGSGLYNFNLWIADYNLEPMWGAATFSQLITTVGVFLKPFGIELHGTVDRIDPFIEFVSSNGYGYSSNIYTALILFVQDFGFFGVIIFPFIMGVFYQWLYNKANKSKNGMWWIVYCILIYPIIFFPISEQLFRRLHLGFIYEIAWPLILYGLVLKPRHAIMKNRQIHQLNGVQNEKRKDY